MSERGTRRGAFAWGPPLRGAAAVLPGLRLRPVRWCRTGTGPFRTLGKGDQGFQLATAIPAGHGLLPGARARPVSDAGALWFLRNYREVWSSFVSDEVARNVDEALEGES